MSPGKGHLKEAVMSGNTISIFHGANLNTGLRVVKPGEGRQVRVDGDVGQKLSGEPLGVQIDRASTEWMDGLKAARAERVHVKLIGKLSLARNIPAIVRACMPNAAQSRGALDINVSVETGQRILPAKWLIEKRLEELKEQVAYLESLRKTKGHYGIHEGQFVIIDLTPREARGTLSRDVTTSLETEVGDID